MSLTDVDRMRNQLQDRIRGIVNDNSGGVKLVKLMTLLASEDLVAGAPVGPSGDDVMRAIDADPTLATHNYFWRMGGSLREKIFVYEI